MIQILLSVIYPLKFHYTMQSFRTEIENPVVEKDILDLEKKIRLYREGKIDDDRFRSLRLARGVYGQRQPGVQMIRIKLPYGQVTPVQLRRICAVSEQYSDGKLHITTRQDVQIHYVSLDRTPQLWAELERDDVTLREACGNTVRNVTASSLAGLDRNEPFNVIPYADALFRYFLRNPMCQELGRKFKISFSSSTEDTAYSYMHDLGFIPMINENGERGFKVLLGGGLGAQPQHAEPIFDFLADDHVIPFAEAALRVFDRNGERQSRNKARLKFLIKDIGVAGFLKLVEEEKLALPHSSYQIEPVPEKELKNIEPFIDLPDDQDFRLWLKTNAIEQKQTGFYAVTLRIPLGDIKIDKARLIAEIVDRFGQNELRFTIEQNLLLPFIRQQDLLHVYQLLKQLDLVSPGSRGLLDITACPGTDTCNLGIASSTGISTELEKVIVNEFPQLIDEPGLNIKISGCMNACGQHSIAAIGYQGMTIKSGNLVAPALQILLGGANLGNGRGVFADKVTKVPSKRGPDSLRYLLTDYIANRLAGERFYQYYERQGKMYFYQLLKPLAENELSPDELIDWGHQVEYVKAIGIGECAGVTIDLVATLITEAQEKIILAEEALKENRLADSIYLSYSAIVNGAKAILTSEDVPTNTHTGIIDSFDEKLVNTGLISLNSSFADLVAKIKLNRPSSAFARDYMAEADSLLQKLRSHYQFKQVSHAS